MTVRSNLSFLKGWIDEEIADLLNGRTVSPEEDLRVLVDQEQWGMEKNFRKKKDVVFECIHNFSLP